MKKLFIPFIFLIYFYPSLTAQDKNKPFFYQIPEYPKEYTATTAVARMVDGLGFRYYWATEGLTPKDLEYKPSKDARTSMETLEHIYGLTSVLFNTVNNKATESQAGAVVKLNFEELRKATLLNLQMSSEILKGDQADLDKFKMIFKNPTKTTEYPFWNLINGPISDALWHVGQVVSFRRGSGNPFPEGVSVLQGTKK
ncbi:MAG: hypothetical protein ABI761_17845 [Saprospiraceae bacterium]